MHGKYSGTVSYWMEGQGPPVIFLHGLGSSKEFWYKNVRDISRRYTCLAIDLPGYGESSLENFDAKIDVYADFLIAFFDQISLLEFYLVSHSMGALIASYMMQKQPERVKKLALVAPAGFEIFNSWQQQAIKNFYTRELTYHLSNEVIKWNFMLNFFQMPDDVQALIRLRINLREKPHFMQYCQTIEQNVSSMLSSVQPESWKDISVPATIIYGLNDRLIPNPVSGLTPLGFSESFKFYMPQANLQTIDKAGHCVMWEQSHQVNEILTTFFSD